MQTQKRRVLEIGHGSHPLPKFIRGLPEGMEYHGIDIMRPCRSPEEFHGYFYRDHMRYMLESGRLRGVADDAVWRYCEALRASVMGRALDMANSIDKCSALAPGRVFFHTMDARELQFAPESFHEVHMRCLTTCLEAPPFLPQIMREAARVLVPGGSLVIVGETKEFCDGTVVRGSGLSVRLDGAMLGDVGDGALGAHTALGGYYVFARGTFGREDYITIAEKPR